MCIEVEEAGQPGTGEVVTSPCCNEGIAAHRVSCTLHRGGGRWRAVMCRGSRALNAVAGAHSGGRQDIDIIKKNCGRFG